MAATGLGLGPALFPQRRVAVGLCWPGRLAAALPPGGLSVEHSRRVRADRRRGEELGARQQGQERRTLFIFSEMPKYRLG